MNIPLIQFKDIDEVRFKRVKDNIYSVEIDSKIITSQGSHGDFIFEAKYCTINPPVLLTHGIHSKFIGDTRCESYELPLNIELLEDSVSKEIFKIISKDRGE